MLYVYEKSLIDKKSDKGPKFDPPPLNHLSAPMGGGHMFFFL